MLNNMPQGAAKQWDDICEKSESRERNIERWQDSLDWHDVQAFAEGTDDIAMLLKAVHDRDWAEAGDIKDKMLRDCAEWNLDNQGPWDREDYENE